MNNRNQRRSPGHGQDQQTIEQIRKSRNRVLALGLAAFVILVFFISIAKMS
ncbi:hypothetical protein [Novosphingobium beihaiensis]|uniref:Cytochrome C oxidase assembly protein n=1 Tax=Novosphingobium beihaiensis TaxID=2930389 RepID=A0ABT0BRQ8_9SPHN|nr:hypothetical protein [Novosphingobium beihaiensis]MCJ2187729.1 hypothetical protein [Novosphingobium beihaiensis]